MHENLTAPGERGNRCIIATDAAAINGDQEVATIDIDNPLDHVRATRLGFDLRDRS